MRIPITYYAPILLILVVLGMVAVALHGTLAADKSKTVEFFASVVGGVAALYALLANVEQRRSDAASSLIERWNRPEFAPFRKKVREAIDAGGPKEDSIHDVTVVLNFCEELALSVLTRRADEKLLKDFFKTVCVRFYAVSQQHIQGVRTKNNQPSAFEHYEALANRWIRK